MKAKLWDEHSCYQSKKGLIVTYSDFSLRRVLQDFNLSTQDSSFLPAITPITPSPYLSDFLERSLPLAIAIGTEKARSEMLISPVLLEPAFRPLTVTLNY